MQIYLAKCCNINGEGLLRIAIGDWTEPDEANVKRKKDMEDDIRFIRIEEEMWQRFNTTVMRIILDTTG